LRRATVEPSPPSEKAAGERGRETEANPMNPKDEESQRTPPAKGFWATVTSLFSASERPEDVEDLEKKLCGEAENSLNSEELIAALQDYVRTSPVPHPDHPEAALAWLEGLYAETFPHSWPKALTDDSKPPKNLLVKHKTVELVLTSVEAPSQRLTVDALAIWPMDFHVESVVEQDAEIAKSDEAFVVYFEDERFGLASFACSRSRNVVTWTVEPQLLWTREDFESIYSKEYFRLVRTEATGFYAGNLSEEWLKDQVVREDENITVVRRSPQLEIALNSCVILGSQPVGNFLRLTKSNWTAFCSSAPKQLQYRNSSEFKVGMKQIYFHEDKRNRVFKVKASLRYLIKYAK